MKKKQIGCLSLLVIIPVLLWLIHLFSYHMLFHADYRIKGTITDTDGNPLNGVYLDREYDVIGTMLPLIRSRETVDSDFQISGSKSSRLSLKFFKKGYYPEKRSFDIGKFWFRKNIRIIMTPSEQVGVSEFHKFQFNEKQKYICDLSDLDHGIIQTQTVDLETNPETKHLEFDFERDENGNIVFILSESLYSFSTSLPSALIIRLHSDDPDDALIRTSGPNTVSNIRAPQTIPETGYNTKEIVIESPEYLDAAFFLKCEGHFGKGELFIPLNSSLNFDEKDATFKFELDVNRKKGDRELHPELKDDYIPRLYY